MKSDPVERAHRPSQISQCTTLFGGDREEALPVKLQLVELCRRNWSKAAARTRKSLSLANSPKNWVFPKALGKKGSDNNEKEDDEEYYNISLEDGHESEFERRLSLASFGSFGQKIPLSSPNDPEFLQPVDLLDVNQEPFPATVELTAQSGVTQPFTHLSPLQSSHKSSQPQDEESTSVPSPNLPNYVSRNIVCRASNSTEGQSLQDSVACEIQHLQLHDLYAPGHKNDIRRPLTESPSDVQSWLTDNGTLSTQDSRPSRHLSTSSPASSLSHWGLGLIRSNTTVERPLQSIGPSSGINEHGAEHPKSKSNESRTSPESSQGSGTKEKPSAKRWRTSTGDWSRADKRNSDDGESDSNDDRDPRSQARVPTKVVEQPEVSFACPFHKRDPALHVRCSTMLLSSVSRVKQHLLRSGFHTEPIHCYRCFATFKNENELKKHTRDVECVRLPDRKWARLSEMQVNLLRKKSARWQTQEQKWFELYAIIFPGEPMPLSPYWDSPFLEGLRSFERFASREGPKLWHEAITKQLPNDLQGRDDLLVILQEAFQATQSTLIEHFLSVDPPGAIPSAAAETMVPERFQYSSLRVVSQTQPVLWQGKEPTSQSSAKCDQDSCVPIVAHRTSSLFQTSTRASASSSASISDGQSSLESGTSNSSDATSIIMPKTFEEQSDGCSIYFCNPFQSNQLSTTPYPAPHDRFIPTLLDFDFDPGPVPKGIASEMTASADAILHNTGDTPLNPDYLTLMPGYQSNLGPRYPDDNGEMEGFINWNHLS
ncbi:hypothetical protein K402DRAFT_163567 [Aulographum hederae CBS 113979]|uniref:C2H2-type domain-containing protein n=1 Tax=Aulographum hederae CBS 113979 TaxID=1176131 RepID=A0A6G1GS01_9PEZI|nr:hypothetical protein K402DRAFT_163567 [Aulographum hederae CBS 113979]